ncbi:Protein csh3 [Microsporum audouinii]
MSTCFFLGIIFSLFPYDYPLLWSAAPTPPSHYDYLEAHLRFLHSSPPLIPRILHIVIAVGLLGLIMKLYKPTESNMLFDGASLVLYMCGITVYIANIVKGLRIVTDGDYGATAAADAAAAAAAAVASGESEDDVGSVPQVLGREDSMKVLAASNTILALVLIGVLVLQAGQWYADRKSQQEAELIKKREEESAEREKAGKDSPKATKRSSTSAANKKKQ